METAQFENALKEAQNRISEFMELSTQFMYSKNDPSYFVKMEKFRSEAEVAVDHVQKSAACLETTPGETSMTAFLVASDVAARCENIQSIYRDIVVKTMERYFPSHSLERG